jgi:hypothetical protein
MLQFYGREAAARLVAAAIYAPLAIINPHTHHYLSITHQHDAPSRAPLSSIHFASAA